MHCVVLDVGKTNAKTAVVDAAGELLEIETMPTPSLANDTYAAIDVDQIFEWFLDRLESFATRWSVHRIVPVAHGASCVLIGADETLALPMLDYEWPMPADIDSEYDALRPAFIETYSPSLPGGLNVGRQLFYFSRRHEKAFKTVRRVLPYPQYWAWRLTGELASEVTSLGCHTDLWSVRDGGYSSLAQSEGWAELFPERQNAWDSVGTLRLDVAYRTGLSRSIEVACGVHDTNAALFPVIATSSDKNTSPSLMSTGTWFIAMSPGASLDGLDEARDCLANVDVFGRSIACSRVMGGRELEVMLGAKPSYEPNADDLKNIFDINALAWPSFTEAGGPFPGCAGSVSAPHELSAEEKTTLGFLYQALMADVCLTLANSENEIIIEGPLVNNRVFCNAIAALRERPVFVRTTSYGVTLGAAALGFWPEHKPPALDLEPCVPEMKSELRAYRNGWRERLSSL